MYIYRWYNWIPLYSSKSGKVLRNRNMTYKVLHIFSSPFLINLERWRKDMEDPVESEEKKPVIFFPYPLVFWVAPFDLKYHNHNFQLIPIFRNFDIGKSVSWWRVSQIFRFVLQKWSLPRSKLFFYGSKWIVLKVNLKIADDCCMKMHAWNIL